MTSQRLPHFDDRVVQAALHQRRWQPQDGVTHPAQLALARSVGALAVSVVGVPVNLDDEATGGSEKINDEVTKDDLTPKGDSETSPPEWQPRGEPLEAMGERASLERAFARERYAERAHEVRKVEELT